MYFYYKIENGTDLSRGNCRLPEVTRQRWYGLVKKNVNVLIGFYPPLILIILRVVYN